MSRLVRLIIKDKTGQDNLADFYQSSNLSPRITKTAFDIENFDSRRGDYTLNLSLPKTKHNDQIFNFVGDIQNRNGFFEQIQYPARIEVDNSVVIDGLFFIDEVDNNSISGTIVGNNISWTELISDKSIRDINLRSIKFSGLRGISNNIFPITQNWAFEPGFPTDLISLFQIWQDTETIRRYDFCMPFLGYGNFFSLSTEDNPLSTTLSITNSSGIDFGSAIDNNILTTDKHQALSQFHFKPACYIKSMIKRLFNDIGYDVSGNFISDTRFDNLIIPASGDEIDNNWNWPFLSKWKVERYNFKMGTPAPLSSWSGGFPGGAPDTTGYYSPIFNSLVTDRRCIWIPGLIPTEDRDLKQSYPTEITKDYAYNEYNYESRNYINIPEFHFPGGPGVNIQFDLDRVDAPYFIAPVDGTYSMTIDIGFNYSAQRQGIGSLQTQDKRFICYIQKFSNTEEIQGNSMYGLEYINTGSVTDPSLMDYQTFFINDPSIVSSHIFSLDTGEIELKQGDKLIFAIATNGYSSRNSVFLDFFACIWDITNTNQDYTLHPNLFLPDIKQIDFVKDVLSLFNLYIFIDDKNKNITINTKNNYFLPPSTAINWNNICDISEATIRPVDFFKLVNFKWQKEDDDGLYSDFYYDKKRISDSKFYTGEKIIETNFAATGIRNYTFIQPISNINPAYQEFLSVDIPTLSNLDEMKTKLGDSSTTNYNKLPRILKYRGLERFTGISGYLAIEDLVFNRGGTYFPNSVVILDCVLPMAEFESTNNYSLSWRDLPNESNPTQIGLFNTFYKQDLEFIEKSSIVELPVKLNSVDISFLDVRRPVIINDQLFIINEVKDFNPIEDSLTDVVLYRR